MFSLPHKTLTAMSLDLYDDDLPAVSLSLLEQWRSGKGMVFSALRIGLAVGSVVGAAAVGIAALADLKGK